jgi:uncharacterized protein YcbX
LTDTTRPQNAPDFSAVIVQLYVYPVKSCAGVAVQEAYLTETGLDLDRAWMVVDEHNAFLTQRLGSRGGRLRHGRDGGAMGQ